MKCHKCQTRATINMRQHKLALCKDHFTQWVLDQTERNIKKYRMFSKKDKILVAVSGGKDSLALWDVLTKLDYQTVGLHINLGINGQNQYSQRSQQFTERFSHARGLDLSIINVEEEFGSSVPEIALFSNRRKSNNCSVCGLVKRHTMNQIAANYNYDVLVTGHNLDDEAAVLFSNTLGWDIDLLHRQSPVLPARMGLIRKAKPFCRFYEKETATYTLLEGIDYIEEECPYSEGSTTIQHKELLNKIEHDHAGTKLAFYLKFLNAKKVLFQDRNEPLSGVDPLFPCDKCGQPTTYPGNCSFCRMIDSIVKNK
jgi:uncharacterized protein (TIGR00269 family)